MAYPKYEPLTTLGEFPPLLFRVFDEERWARALIEEGRLRFRLIDHYAQMEDKIRADESEGVSHLQVPGNVSRITIGDKGQIDVKTERGLVDYTGEFINRIYICCFTYPPGGNLSRLPSKFGKYVVKIDDPQRLAQDITDWLTEEGALRGTPVVECWPVVYNKGKVSEEIRDHSERVRLIYTQKPPLFAEEYEYRLAVKATPPPGDARLGADHHVVLGKTLSYASLIRLS